MNVLFKCFKCECGDGKAGNNKKDEKDEKDKKGEIKMKIHSYTWNKTKEPKKIKELCEHFSEIELYWKTRYRFFTIGWKVEIYNVSVKCNLCSNRRIYFTDKTFGYEQNNNYEEEKECHDNVIVYSAHEGKFKCDKGKNLQENINQQIQELKELEEKLEKLNEEKEKLEKEEKLRKEREEEEKREREEEERKEKEKEKSRRSQYTKENKEMLEINKQQEKEDKELNQRYKTGTSWIEEQKSQMISETNTNISINNSINVQKTIKATYQIQAGK